MGFHLRPAKCTAQLAGILKSPIAWPQPETRCQPQDQKGSPGATPGPSPRPPLQSDTPVWSTKPGGVCQSQRGPCAWRGGLEAGLEGGLERGLGRGLVEGGQPGAPGLQKGGMAGVGREQKLRMAGLSLYDPFEEGGCGAPQLPCKSRRISPFVSTIMNFLHFVPMA